MTTGTEELAPRSSLFLCLLMIDEGVTFLVASEVTEEPGRIDQEMGDRACDINVVEKVSHVISSSSFIAVLTRPR